MTKHYDAIVVGIGAMGSATLYQLSKRGFNALGIEQFGIPHSMGSSHGLTRIIRLAYYEDPAYVPLLRRAYELWHELEREADERLLIQTGSLDIGPADSEVFAGSLQSCIEHELPHEAFDGRELSRRFPGFRMPADSMALYQPEGGYLLPEHCIRTYARLAQSHGVTVHTGERLLGWDILPDGRVAARTDSATYTADKLVLCGGAWASKLAPVLHGKAVPERQVLIWLRTKQPKLFTPESFPVWNAMVDEGRYYGFPEVNPNGDTPGMKFGRWHHRDEVCDPDALDRETHPEDEALLRGFAERYFPDGAGETLNMAACMFTNTADEHFILDTLPGRPQVSLAAGFSGHGFKFSSVVGEIMADLALDGTTRHDIKLHRLSRTPLGPPIEIGG